MAISSPKHEITRGKTGWFKWIHGRTVWIAGLKAAPTGKDADRVYEQRLALPDGDKRKIRLDQAPGAKGERLEHIELDAIANAYLTRKLRQVEVGRLTEDTLNEYTGAIKEFCDHVGATTRFCDLASHHFSDFADALGKRFGLYRLQKYLIIVRMLFRWAGPAPGGVGLVPALPDYGDAFRLPARSEFRRAKHLARAADGVKRYTSAQVREQLDGKVVNIKRKRKMLLKSGETKIVKDVQERHRRPSKALKAMILLALNGGFGNRDCAYLPITIAEPALRDGWMDYARDKTGAERLFWLWPETRAALEAWWAARQKIKPAKGSVNLWGVERDYKDLFFLTKEGRPWVVGKKDQIGMRYAALLRALGQTSRGFRSLRRTCRTVLAETAQELAVDMIMGHADDAQDMARTYTVEVSREIIRTVCQHGREKLLFADRQGMLFPEPGK